MKFHHLLKGWDWIILVLLIFIAFIPSIVFSYYQANIPDDAEIIAVISVNNKEIDRITLTGNRGSEILNYPEVPGDHNTIEVRDEEIRMYEIDCPDQICVNTGFVSKPGQTIVCLHYNIVVEIIATGAVEVEDDMIISY